MSLKKAVLARKLAEEKHRAWLLENAEENIGNIIVRDKELCMYYNAEKRYRSWTDIVGGLQLTNYWNELTEDYDEEDDMLVKLAGGYGLGYYTDVELFEKKENGHYRVIMTVEEGTCFFHRKWDIILCEKGHILQKTKLNKDGTIDINYNEDDDVIK